VDSLLLASHACMRFFVAGRTDGQKTGWALQSHFIRATAINLFTIRSRAVLQFLLVLLKICMKRSLDKIAECLRWEEATNKWDGNRNVAGCFISDTH
jgi:hypothetical protein